MHFFRPAKEEDFKGCEIEYDYGRLMSQAVKALIEQDLMQEAVKQFKAETGLGLTTLKKYCETYQTYLFAKQDFEDGKQVFVSY